MLSPSNYHSNDTLLSFQCVFIMHTRCLQHNEESMKLAGFELKNHLSHGGSKQAEAVARMPGTHECMCI